MLRLTSRRISGYSSVCYSSVKFNITTVRFNSSTSKKDELTSSNQKDKDVSNYHIKQTTSKSAPAPIDPIESGLDQLVKKNVKPYIPKLQHQRLSYEYPGLPNEDEFTKVQGPKLTTRWSRYIPKILSGIVLVWAGYSIKVWIYAPEKGADSKELLNPQEFHKFIITHKEQIDNDHYLIEVIPKYDHWRYSFLTNYEEKSVWNGDRIWSVDIKQPEIMVVRSYTPLPLYFLKSEYTRSGEKKPLLKVINPEIEEYDHGGVMTFYIKRYNDGEVSRYITSRNIGDELELRGPNVEYKFPYHPLKKFHTRPIFRDLPSKIEAESLLDGIKKVHQIPEFDNINFYGAGTGIAPILQVLMSRNPYRGFINIHYSAQKPGELQPLARFMFFLEKIDRVAVHYHYDNEKSGLTSKDISDPVPPNYVSAQRLEAQAQAQAQPEAQPEAVDVLQLRMDILKDNDKKHSSATETATNPVTESEIERAPRYENAIQQALVTSTQPKKDASLSIVCGPDGYVEYVAGAKDLVHNEQGPIGGLLSNHKWDTYNVYKL
ncbi:uncharacterized protein RJT21DRAFT_120350 [Scheffersomyces amazonensis]|uniref:uncharacterized protein n=1 Tax=Scheffersomyces amazonensis TaxID=1078765 RepID=UPI00315DB8A1